MTHTWERTGGSSSRGLAFGFILLGHLGFFWMLNSGLASGSAIRDRIFDVIDLVEPAPKEEVVDLLPPPPIPLKFKEAEVLPPKFVEAPVVGTVGEGAISLPATRELPVEPVVTAVKKIVLPMSNPRRPLTQPPYPSSSQRLGEEGTVILELYVLENGRVGDATVYKSSGYPKLDQAAVEEAKRAWRLLPGTEDGQPKAMRYQLGVTFRINT